MNEHLLNYYFLNEKRILSLLTTIRIVRKKLDYCDNEYCFLDEHPLLGEGETSSMQSTKEAR